MAISAAPPGGDDNSPMSEINVVPLTDVMLVLLIIFLIAVPVVIQAVPVELPKVVYEPTTTKPENVSLSVRAAPTGECEVFWNLTKVDAAQLLDLSVAKLRREIDRQGGPTAVGLELPEAHIRGDENTPYRCIGGAVFTLQRAGFARIGFISQPPAGFSAQRF